MAKREKGEGGKPKKEKKFDESKGAGDFDWAALLPKTFPVELTRLNPYENNPRINEKAIPYVKRSIRRFGFIVPIVVDKQDSLVIAAGHTRLAAALELCKEEGRDPKTVRVMCLSAEHLTPSMIRQFRLADNRVATFSEDDTDKLAKELFALKDDWDAEAFGFDASDWGFGDKVQEYTKKVCTPEYKVTGVEPKVEELYDTEKVGQLIERIDKAEGVSEEIKDFLRAAAWRHCKINFAMVAEFYAHANAQVQELFEDSALVFIDYDRAVSDGYVKLSEKLENEF